MRSWASWRRLPAKGVPGVNGAIRGLVVGGVGRGEHADGVKGLVALAAQEEIVRAGIHLLQRRRGEGWGLRRRDGCERGAFVGVDGEILQVGE